MPPAEHTPIARSRQGLHVIAKPIGPLCNLRCSYCFYLRKQSLYAEDETWRMSDETLEAYVRQYVEAQPENAEQIDFAFQGGEPTLLGIDFFRRVVQLQQKHAGGKRVRNALQTNGVLLDDDWCRFLKQHGFLVGLHLVMLQDAPDSLFVPSRWIMRLSHCFLLRRRRRACLAFGPSRREGIDGCLQPGATPCILCALRRFCVNVRVPVCKGFHDPTSRY